MVILIIRLMLLFYVLGLFIFIVLRLAHKTENKKGVLAILLFPLMLLTKKGRDNLLKG